MIGMEMREEDMLNLASVNLLPREEIRLLKTGLPPDGRGPAVETFRKRLRSLNKQGAVSRVDNSFSMLWMCQMQKEGVKLSELQTATS